MLATVRESLRLSQQELADLLKVSQPLIARWEIESAKPDDDQIEKLTQSLKVRRDIFFIDRSRKLATMSDYYHRSLAKAPRRDVKAVHARCSIIDIQIDRLLQATGPWECTIPDIDPADYPVFDAETTASAVRRRMGIGAGPIQNLVGAIERCGGIVIDYAIDAAEVDALCRWVPGLPKLFFLNGSKPPDRIRHSLSHELGHTVLHFGRELDHHEAEEQANKFASAFLMPATEIKHDFRSGSVTLADLAAIKRKWRVSMQSAAMRARSIGAIDERRYKWLQIQMSKAGWRKAEPVTIDGETPMVFKQLLQQQIDKGFSLKDLADLLLVSEEYVSTLLADAVNAPTFEEDGVRLRLVRD